MVFFIFGLLFALPARAAYEPCGVQMERLGTYAARPGQAFQMFGRWGHAQGAKIPAINGPTQGVLDVVSWGDRELIVKVPLDLEPGAYMVGVYCNPLGEPYNGSYSSGWVEFRVEGNGPAVDLGARASKPLSRTMPERDSLEWFKILAPWAAFAAIMLVGVLRHLRKGKDNLPRPLN